MTRFFYFHLTILISLFTFQISKSQSNELPEFWRINISKGPIIGKLLRSYDGEQAYTFLGIPLAKPTIGELRFLPPQAVEPWTEPIYTTQYRNACMANPKLTYKTISGGPVSEDCLYVNVYASHHCLHMGGCPVLVVIHGGRYNFESPVVYNSSIIVHNFAGQSRNIVVVTIPYRLGLFGFLNMPYGAKSSLFKRNLGLHDIHHGFKWIQKEAANFGGDPKRVTAYGHSAGAVLGTAIFASPKFNNLFQQVITQSSTFPGMIMKEETNTYASTKIAKLVGCSNGTIRPKDVENVIRCLITKDANELREAQTKLDNYVEDFIGPCVDGELIPAPFNRLRYTMKKRNALIGTVLHEFKTTQHIIDKKTGKVNETRLYEICHSIAYLYEVKDPLAAETACYAYYALGNNSAQLSDDLDMYVHTANFANDVSGHASKVYVYSYTYNGAGNAFKKYNPDALSPGHSEDFIYLFGMHRGEFTEKDYKVEKLYTEMLANFVKHNDPSVSGHEKWRSWDEDQMNFYQIDFDDSLNMPGNKLGYYKDPYNLWEKFIPKISGWKFDAKRFPIGIDCCMDAYYFDSTVSHWTNVSFSHSKDYLAMDETYRRCTELVDFDEAEFYMKKIGILKRDSTLAEISNGNSVLLYISISIGILVFVIGMIKFIKYRKRRNYNPL